MKKILWLCSWYPSVADSFNGDFIQRHAKAASLFNNIHVIHVGGSTTINQLVDNFKQDGGLTEHVIVYKSRKTGIGRFYNHLLWKKLFKRAVEDYINKNGKPDLVHVHVPMKAGLIALWVKKKFHIKYLVTEHWAIYDARSDRNYDSRGWWFKKISKKIINDAELIIPVSENLGKLMNSKFLPKDFKVIQNTVDIALFNNTKSQFTSNSFRFIHVSNLNFQKNPQAIVSAFTKLTKKNNDVELFLIGPYPKSLIQHVEGIGLLNKTIFLIGEIEYKQVAREMKKANGFVMFSRFENLPCAILEALCCGLPVISSDVGGISEVINKENGILVESGNKIQLQNAMVDMISRYHEFDKNKIARDAQSQFSYQVIGKQFDDLYKSLINDEE